MNLISNATYPGELQGNSEAYYSSTDSYSSFPVFNAFTFEMSLQIFKESIHTLYNSCISKLSLGFTVSLVTNNPLPSVFASLSCVKGAEAAESLFQGVVKLGPRQTWYSEGSRKIAFCKSGKTFWNPKQTCDYKGPPMIVTVIFSEGRCDDRVLYKGPLTGSWQWEKTYWNGERRLSVSLENPSDTESSNMYVHLI